MKKVIAVFLAVWMILATGCSKSEPKDIKPEVSQMKSICELAVMECYYHTVAKYSEENAEGWWLWMKDKKFWVEYSGVVTLGLDVSKVKIEVEDTVVTITIPEAEVLGCRVDSSTLTEESFIVAKDSAKVTAEDEVLAYDMAEDALEETAAANTALLFEARQRAQTLLEDYVMNIGEVMEREYTIQWIYLDETTSESDTERAVTSTTE